MEFKFILLTENKIILCKDNKDLVKECGISISSIRRRLKYSNIINNTYIYKIVDPLLDYNKKYINYFLISLDHKIIKIYNSLKEISDKNDWDYSNLCKVLKGNTKYKTIGGFNRGRKKQNENEPGYKIYIIVKDKLTHFIDYKFSEIEDYFNENIDNDIIDSEITKEESKPSE